jgi:hypothetical protein
MNKLKSCIALCLIAIAFTGCKGEEKKAEGGEKAGNPSVEVVVDMVVKNDDVFQLFYTEGGNDFGPNSVYVNVPGKPESQQIVFDLPDDAYVGNLRLDVGQNEAQGEMAINKMIVKISDKELELSSADFLKYFTPAGYVKVDAGKSSFTGVKVDGIYDPFFTGNDALVQALRNLN